MFKRKAKNPNWFSRKIEVKKSSIEDAGIGIFATELIEKREIFESAPVILFHFELLKDYVELTGEKHVLCDHVFNWSGSNLAMCLGYGSIYNHSNSPNALHRRVFDKESPRIEFIAKRDINPGEEIFHHYAPKGGDLFFTDSGHYDFDSPIRDAEKI